MRAGSGSQQHVEGRPLSPLENSTGHGGTALTDPETEAEDGGDGAERGLHTSRVTDTAASTDSQAQSPSDGGRTVIRGSLALFSTQPITWTMSALSVAFVPRYLSARELGFASVAMSIAALATLFAGLGVSNIIVRELGSGSAKESFAGSAYVLLFLSSVVVAGVVEAGLLLLGVRGLQLVVCELALVGMVLSVPATVMGCTLIARKRFAVYAWFTVLTSVPMLAFLIVLVLGGGLVWASSATVATMMLPMAVGWRLVKWRVARAWFDRKVWRHLLYGGAPFIALSVAMWVYGDGAKLMLNIMAGPEAIGWHAAAMRIPAVMVFIPTLLATPLLPTLSRQRDNRLEFNQTLSTTLLTAVLLTVPISAGVFGLAARLPDVLGWSDSFSQSIPLIRILVFEQPVVAVDVLLGTAAIAIGRERRLLLNSIVAAVASIVLNVILIPIFERRGNAAIGSDIAQLVTEFLLLVLIVRVMPHGTFGRFFISRVTRVVIAGVAMGAVVHVLAPRQFIAAGVIGLIVYGAALLMLRVFALSQIVPAGAQLVRGIRQRVKR